MTGGLSTERAAALRENINSIREEIAQLAPGRDVTLLGATKTVPAEIINYAARECGLTAVGENRVQELTEKYPLLDHENVEIHFIGRLQRNKVRHLIGKVTLIHSVDSIELAREIDKRSRAAGLCTDILVQINTGLEDTKGGVAPAQADEFLASLQQFENIRVRGLMAMTPICSDPEDYRRYFELAKSLFDRNFTQPGDILSMGMTDSYRQALLCGSNLIRVGSAIFGKRE
ncbi:MAG: YggS family pyridoxal phosphate-dependent enzyme [Eubacteriales bacterium]|jgi:pyridoxal phosphate enzyme (YggS family)|nr:YggS family pyridoxal phosphate-dependent enzyme [Clostridiales bacterium]